MSSFRFVFCLLFVVLFAHLVNCQFGPPPGPGNNSSALELGAGNKIQKLKARSAVAVGQGETVLYGSTGWVGMSSGTLSGGYYCTNYATNSAYTLASTSMSAFEQVALGTAWCQISGNSVNVCSSASGSAPAFPWVMCAYALTYGA